MSDDQLTSISKQVADLGQQFKAQNEKSEQRFAAHDKRFDAIDARLDKHDAVLDRLAAEVAKKADKADVEALSLKMDASFDRVFGVLDTILKTLETHEQERLAANHQLDRHEEWIARAAPKLNVSYDAAA